jgi:hypothetical protein
MGTHEMPENGSTRTVRDQEAMTLSARNREIFRRRAFEAARSPPRPGRVCAGRRSATSSESPNRCRLSGDKHHKLVAGEEIPRTIPECFCLRRFIRSFEKFRAARGRVTSADESGSI